MPLSRLLVAGIVAVWCLVPASASAKNTIPTETKPSPCAKHAGPAGVLFDGYYDTIQAPLGFESVSISDFDGTVYVDGTVRNSHVSIFAGVNLGQNLLVWSQLLTGLKRTSMIQFKDREEEVMHTCFVDVVEFDPTEHDAASLSLGFCDFNQTAGISLLPNHATQVFDLPEEYREGATSPTGVLEHSPLPGGRQIQLRGRASGLATLVWLGKDMGDGPLKGVCAVFVSDQ